MERGGTVGLLIPVEQEKLRPCLEMPNPEGGGEEEDGVSTSPPPVVVAMSSSWIVAGLFEMELFEEA